MLFRSVFSTAREMYVFLQAYNGTSTGQATASQPAVSQAAASQAVASSSGSATSSAPARPASPIIAFVSLYREGKKAFESTPIAVPPQAESRLGVTPFSFQIGLSGLAPGEYQCQVSVLDPAGHRVAFWVNPVMLVR